MNITEELLQLVSLKGTTSGRDINDPVINCAQDRQIDLKNLEGIATDGALSMFGEIVDLCAQVLNMSHVMKIVVKVTKSIKNNPLKYHQFQEYLRELESEYGDLIYYTKIR
ncbi:hypothetical protein TNIN_324691 [Trichonephila inaurata madagascariensis]|uniref:Uncharacterized protein n=1 Tax=Trichonephila inaurata madagascariensis TaxID=2747483 RepID=A0A8X6XR35_9ARAC|nr:hypothetical protein TNIN_324691 [Trichonephila inaurata madagascariensis]